MAARGTKLAAGAWLASRRSTWLMVMALAVVFVLRLHLSLPRVVEESSTSVEVGTPLTAPHGRHGPSSSAARLHGGATTTANAAAAATTGSADAAAAAAAVSEEQTASAPPYAPRPVNHLAHKNVSVAELQRDDRTAEAVHVMPDGSVQGALFMDDADMRRFFPCENKTVLCRAQYKFRKCRWCSHEDGECIVGELEANGGVVYWWHTKEQGERLANAARAFTRHEPWNRWDPVTDVMLFACRFNPGGQQIPMNVPGRFSLRLPVTQYGKAKEVVMSHELTRSPPIVPKGSVATCGRATYGDANANHIIQMSEYLRFHGFQTLYMYNAGSTTMREPLKLQAYLARLAREGSTSLRYLDMRNHLDALYGGSAEYAFLTSHSGGQEWTKYDCALRALRDGHEWILYTDVDEYIFPGKAMIEDDVMVPMAERLKAQVEEGSNGFDFGAVNPKCDDDLNPDSDWPLDPAESEARWAAWMRRVSKHHVEVEMANPLKYFSTNGHKPRQPPGRNGCEDYHFCAHGQGTRKNFFSVNFPPIGLMVHEHVGGEPVTALDADVLHSRHYRCINSMRYTPRLLGFPNKMKDS